MQYFSGVEVHIRTPSGRASSEFNFLACAAINLTIELAAGQGNFTSKSSYNSRTGKPTTLK